MIENAEEVNRQGRNQILLIRNVDENRNNLVNESELHENIILESNGNLNSGRKDFVDREEVKNLFAIFVKIAEDWQNISQEVANLYDIKNYNHALDEGGLKLQKISEYLTDASKGLVSIKNFPANIINSKLVSDFLNCLEKVVYDTEWVDDINKNYRKYVEECYVNMGNRQGGQRRPNNNPQIRNLGNLNGYIANLRRNNNNEGPENFEEMVNMLNAERHTNTQHRNRINNVERRMNNVEERVNNLEEREHQMNENMRSIQNAMTSVTNKLELIDERIEKSGEKFKMMDEQGKIHAEKMKKLDQELEEIKRKNKEESDKRDKELAEIKQKNKERNEKVDKEFEEYKKQNQKDIDEMKQKTAELYAKLFERAEKGEKSANELYEKIHNLSHQVSSISSQNSSRNLSRNESFRIFSNSPRGSQIKHELYNGEDNFGSDRETPGNERNANSGFKNANDHININLNVNQQENDKNDEKKSLIDRMKEIKNKEKNKKEQIPKQAQEKQFEEDKKEDEKK